MAMVVAQTENDTFGISGFLSEAENEEGDVTMENKDLRSCHIHSKLRGMLQYSEPAIDLCMDCNSNCRTSECCTLLMLWYLAYHCKDPIRLLRDMDGIFSEYFHKDSV